MRRSTIDLKSYLRSFGDSFEGSHSWHLSWMRRHSNTVRIKKEKVRTLPVYLVLRRGFFGNLLISSTTNLISSEVQLCSYKYRKITRGILSSKSQATLLNSLTRRGTLSSEGNLLMIPPFSPLVSDANSLTT